LAPGYQGVPEDHHDDFLGSAVLDTGITTITAPDREVRE